MNSLNIVSRLATPPATPLPRSRTSSSHQVQTLGSTVHDDSDSGSGSALLNMTTLSEKLGFGGGGKGNKEAEDAVRNDRHGEDDAEDDESIDEKKPLLGTHASSVDVESQKASIWQLPGRAAKAMLYGVQVVFSTITAPVRYIIACFYDEQGHFSTILPLTRLSSLMKQRRQHSTAQAVGLNAAALDASPEEKARPRRKSSTRRTPSISSIASTASAGSSSGDDADAIPPRHTRAHKPSTDSDGSSAIPPKKSIRYKEETLRKRRGTKTRKPSADDVATVASTLKSPSSPNNAMKLTRYPRHPAPPRPLVPRRQPSYTLAYAPDTPKKTLIIDLDETLIHSMAKGGRMSTGHMVEVRMTAPVATSGVQLPPGLPILYYVHERPGCHDFLRKVCKWYHLVVFTASVQEYADPVIDWLERERKYFSARYYRQHCTFRNGAYIKDLAQVEPDLSKVMILDNSPMSYIFHEDNAIPIEGWISDPTDNDLLHLVPLLEGLQYVTDVRALLALRQGQAPQA